MPTPTSKRLYLRGLPPDATKEKLEKLLSSYGSMIEIKILAYCAFVEFESIEDATRVLETFSNSDLLGKRVIIEYAHPMRRDILSKSSNNISPKSATRPSHNTRHPIVVLDLPRNIGWKELKDFGRSSGALVSFCDLDKDQMDKGFIEFFSQEDAKRAIQVLNGQRLRGQRVRVVDHQDWRAYSRAYGNRSDRERSRSPDRLHHHRRARAIYAAGSISTSPENGVSVGYFELHPDTHAYDTSMRGRAWYPRRGRSQEDEYDLYDHYARTVPLTRDYEYDKEDRRSQERLDIQVEQEASYLCHRRTRFIAAAADDTLQGFQQHHLDYCHHHKILNSPHSDGDGFGEQQQKQWSANKSDYHWPGYGLETGHHSTFSDAEYPSRLDEAHLIQQRLTLHSYQ